MVFEAAGPEMCTFGVLGLSCEAAAAPKPLGEESRSGGKWSGRGRTGNFKKKKKREPSAQGLEPVIGGT